VDLLVEQCSPPNYAGKYLGLNIKLDLPR
jgi:hypothetical protein